MSNQATARLRTLPELVIFDCDGVLVDSEGPANRILAKALRREGLDVDEAEVAKATTGITLAAVVAWAEGLLGKPLPSDFLDRLRVETYAAFKSELTAVSGVARAVDAVQASGVKTCVASSGSIEKMNLTLGLTGLLDKFQSRLFSAKQVEHGKPHPDVFLLAAREMGVAPPRRNRGGGQLTGRASGCRGRYDGVRLRGAGTCRGRSRTRGIGRRRRAGISTDGRVAGSHRHSQSQGASLAMQEGGSKKVIFAALAGNSLIAITKFGAAFYTGSSAMLSEAIHSLVDTGNQGLILHGMNRAKKPADAAHPFGYGMEIYFWTFVVAILIFAGGAGVSIYEGVSKVLEPHPVTNPMINYIVLSAALVFEGFAWWIAYKEFGRTQGRYGVFEAVGRSKDPTVFTVLFEDTAAGLGLIVAFIGIALAQYLEMPVLDGAASIVIGIILALTAAFLAYETKGLLIGEAAQPKVVDAITRIAKAEQAVIGVNEVLTMHLGPADVLLNISLDFADHIGSDDVESAVSDIERRIKLQHPEITRIFIEAQNRHQHRRSAAT